MSGGGGEGPESVCMTLEEMQSRLKEYVAARAGRSYKPPPDEKNDLYEEAKRIFAKDLIDIQTEIGQQ